MKIIINTKKKEVRIPPNITNTTTATNTTKNSTTPPNITSTITKNSTTPQIITNTTTATTPQIISNSFCFKEDITSRKKDPNCKKHHLYDVRFLSLVKDFYLKLSKEEKDNFIKFEEEFYSMDIPLDEKLILFNSNFRTNFKSKYLIICFEIISKNYLIGENEQKYICDGLDYSYSYWESNNTSAFKVNLFKYKINILTVQNKENFLYLLYILKNQFNILGVFIFGHGDDKGNFYQQIQQDKDIETLSKLDLTCILTACKNCKIKYVHLAFCNSFVNKQAQNFKKEIYITGFQGDILLGGSEEFHRTYLKYLEDNNYLLSTIEDFLNFTYARFESFKFKKI